MQITHKFNWIARFSVFSSALIIAMLLVACGGSSSDTAIVPVPVPVPVPTAIGYYTGGASVLEEDDLTTLTIEDLQGIFDGTNFKFMSVAKDLLYDGKVTSRTGDDFTADVTIYKFGANPYSATVSGTITDGSQFTGTFSGTKAGNGTFTLIYALSNSETADISRITKTFSDSALGFFSAVGSGIALSINSSGNILPVASGQENSIFQDCSIALGTNSKITPIVSSNIYSISVELELCKNSNRDGVYTGLATTKINTNADDTLVLIVTGGFVDPNTGDSGLAGDFGP